MSTEIRLDTRKTEVLEKNIWSERIITHGTKEEILYIPRHISSLL